MTSVYVVAHKTFDFYKYNLDSCYKVIRVGKYSEDQSGLGISDSTGDNIAIKNPNYCELTALYWIWKNDTASEIKGLCHYRRYFMKSKISTDSECILSEKDVQTFLKDHDAIVSATEVFSCGNYEEYLRCGHQKDLDLTKEAISVLFPDYLKTYEEEFEHGNRLNGFNMLIAKKNIFDAYCEWLFAVLNYVEERLDISSYTAQEARVYGYLSERLLRVWLRYNNVKCKECRVINTEDKKNLKFYTREILEVLGLFNFGKGLSYKLRGKQRK